MKPTAGIVDEYFNDSTGDGDEGDTDMPGPWTSSIGLHPVDSQMVGGKGLSVRHERENRRRGSRETG